ncbi:MAG: efflux RND transporter periplasmic adaptor subunit [Candidatus Aminicenantes bacterium]|nr:efflux RND transporter periplasmic adaptor subunit [Candidatus Aminicenantes bacterium]
MFKRRQAKFFVFLIVGLILLAFVSCQRPTEKKTTGAGDELKPAPVKVYKVKRQKISEKLVYTATLEAWKKQAITPDIAGKVARIYVSEGEKVKKGQLLAELDTESIRLQLKQAEAALALAKANYEDARRNLERMKRLFEEKAVSDQQYEKVRLAFEAAQAQKDQAEAAVNLAKHSLEVSIMRAPFDGVIASKNLEEGDVINPMMGGFSPSSSVLTLVDYSKIKVRFDVSPTDALRITKGQKVYLESFALPGQQFEGEITVVNTSADPQTKKFRVEAVVNNPELALKPGTFGRVILEVSTKENSLAVPQRAILENSYVLVVKGNKAVKKTVTTGLKNTDLVEITSGLNEGDLVIVEGNFGLADGSPVEVTGEVEK